MTSTGWIAVAGLLIASPVFAQSLDSTSAPATSEATSAVTVAPQRGDVASFDSELDRLGQDIAAIKTLREQVAEEAGQPLTSDAAAAQELRRELLDLLTKLASKNVTPRPAPEVPQPQKSAPPPASKSEAAKAEAKPGTTAGHPLITDKIVDPFALGRALFRSGDFRGAEQAFRKVKVTEDNLVLLQYLVATCLRKQSLWDQAAKAYRVVAENKSDPALRDLALWQLENIRWYQQTETQLEQLQQLRESSDASKDSPPVAKAAASPR